MHSDRIQLLERKSDYFQKILSAPKAEQLRSLGIDNDLDLKIQLDRVNRILDSAPHSWRNWDIIWKETKSVIGNCGFHSYQERHRRAEIGYGISENFRRRGITTEAVGMIIQYGFEEMNLNRIEACVGPDNIPSIRIIEKAGFTKEGVLRQHYIDNGAIFDSIIYSLLREDF